MNAYVASVIENVKKKHGNEPEFVQTVEEVFSSISPVIDEKIEAVRCHVCQNREDHMALRTRERNRSRGTESKLQYAEGFKSPLPLTNHSRSILFEL